MRLDGIIPRVCHRPASPSPRTAAAPDPGRRGRSGSVRSSGGLFIRHTGVPDLTYRLQGAANLTGPWSDRATNIMPPSGFIEFHETSPPPGGYFYRAIQP